LSLAINEVKDKQDKLNPLEREKPQGMISLDINDFLNIFETEKIKNLEADLKGIQERNIKLIEKLIQISSSETGSKEEIKKLIENVNQFKGQVTFDVEHMDMIKGLTDLTSIQGLLNSASVDLETFSDSLTRDLERINSLYLKGNLEELNKEIKNFKKTVDDKLKNPLFNNWINQAVNEINLEVY